jgi:hypothetical protein
VGGEDRILPSDGQKGALFGQSVMKPSRSPHRLALLFVYVLTMRNGLLDSTAYERLGRLIFSTSPNPTFKMPLGTAAKALNSSLGINASPRPARFFCGNHTSK